MMSLIAFHPTMPTSSPLQAVACFTRLAEQSAETVASQARLLGIADVSMTPRVGLKGPGAAAWLSDAGVPLPQGPNQFLFLPQGGFVLRLGMTEYLIESPDSAWVASLGARPRTAGVYPVLRQDAALQVAGEQMSSLWVQVCNVDLRRLHQGMSVVLTSMAGVSVTVLAVDRPQGPLFHVWCDGTFGPYLSETLCGIAEELGGGSVPVAALS